MQEHHNKMGDPNCSYKNLELEHVRVDVTKVGSRTSPIDYENDLC